MAKSVVVIGGGPGGYAAALYGAKLGLQVTLVEKADIGGTCLNRGCIPTKAFLHAAGIFRELAAAKACGIHAKQVEVDFSRTAKYKDKTVRQLRGGVEMLLKRNRVEVLTGKARLADARTVEVQMPGGGTAVFTPDAVVLASGSREIPLANFETNGQSILNSTQMLGITELPKSAIIIGGGVIGVEFASVLAGFGKSVTIVEYAPCILPGLDHDVSRTLHNALEAQGVSILAGAQAKRVLADTGNALSIEVLREGETLELQAEKVLVCIGRAANLDGLGLDAAGVAHDGRVVATNARMQTSVPHIYAVGDITASPQLAHVAYREALVAMRNIAGEPAEMDGRAVPSCVYSHPEAASVGQSEQQARQNGDIRVEIQPFMGNGKAIIEQQQADGFVKMVYDADGGRLLGCSIVGPRATELICEPALAIHKSLAVADIAGSLHAHPSLGELLGETAEAALGCGLHSL